MEEKKAMLKNLITLDNQYTAEINELQENYNKVKGTEEITK